MLLNDRLSGGLNQIGLPVTARQSEQLDSYLYLIQKWNQTYNLVADCRTEPLLIRHLFDCLSALPLASISPDAHVLDVGCGDGMLMELLAKEKNVNIRGIEISKIKVQNCIAKGLTIIEGNAENDLRQFPDKSFDYVILSQTLQAFLKPEKVINELLRIGKQAIVTIPNFGYWKIRLHLLLKGTMPVTKTLPDEWYNTPNIHLCTIKDFVHFSKNKNFKLSKSIALKDNQQSFISNYNLKLKNLSSNLGIFLIER